MPPAARAATAPVPRPETASEIAPAGAHVLVLMAVHEGVRFLPGQLASLEGQRHRDWSLLASVEGKPDGSTAVLDAFAARQARSGRRVARIAGPGRGPGANFLHLLRAARRQAPEGCWLAFCDQDDHWLPERLERGITALRAAKEDSAMPAAGQGPGGAPAGGLGRPGLWCSRSWITDAGLGRRRLSAPRRRPLGVRNALVQNVVAGNTLLLDPAGTRLALAAAGDLGAEPGRPLTAGPLPYPPAGPCPVPMHDWWLYLLLAGAGGRLLHDPEPSLLYRQHGANAVGANEGWRARARRARMVLAGEWRDWTGANLAALERSAHRLTPEARTLLAEFARVRRLGPLGRLAGLRRLGLYRQTRAGTWALRVTALLGRL